ncbi:unnamed protein product [Tilletia controversa]|uniref:Uncharacterized protein n=2 Tax=Tilletia TaxID=13289 RepID=A0A177VBJ1_9BASI|nr:hypothetical protein CF336_g7454 [Tilletia laevis]KAE8190259.1 hypothetical protein CF328_g6028 [Tilletia controversa]KAE8243279.1 hypothetical protein A4X03_0g7810 [Tilletia caries]KAE8188542.1 hypothetical protein CF335_g6869 [Tilletia laevis]CAD6884624.1 unnamed protein product [Tilletia caries]
MARSSLAARIAAADSVAGPNWEKQLGGIIDRVYADSTRSFMTRVRRAYEEYVLTRHFSGRLADLDHPTDEERQLAST